MLLRSFCLASGFVTTLLMTHWLGAEGLGVYNYAISWIVLVVIFVKFGFEEFLIRETAARQATDDHETVHRLWNFARLFVIGGSMVAIAIFLIVISRVEFENITLRNTLLIGLAMIPLLSLLGLYRGVFRANKRIINSQLPEFVIRPIVLMSSFASLLLLNVVGSASIAIMVNVLATLCALLFCFWTAKNNKQEPSVQPATETKHTTAPHSIKSWLLGAMPFVLIAGIHIINQRTDRLMLGSLLDMESVGLYSVAMQMALVVNFTLLGINQAVAPLVAERYEADRHHELQSILIRATTYATAGSLLIVLGLACLGGWVLPIFGPEFTASYYPLLILAAGQLINVAAGPVGELLTMSRKVHIVGIGVGISAVANIVLNLWLIPIYGIIGAAIATSVSMAVWNLVLVAFAKYQLGVSTNLLAQLIPAAQSRP